jgi:release factor glutamine methyltransferase
MLTILDAINRSAEYLEKKGIEDPRINAEILLCNILNCKKIFLYLNYDRPLTDDEVIIYRQVLKRRGEREPLQYITGKVEFYGLPFKVNSSVLIPRPETELLVEKVINDNKNTNIKILDIGTGSGNIAISLKYHLPLAEVTSVDKSEEALSVALSNAELNSCSGKIHFVKSDILSNEFESLNKYDIIVSNPPYISEEDYNKLEPELRVYEPKIALSDLGDGYLFYKRIIDVSDRLLNAKGKIYLEMGEGQSSAIKEFLVINNFNNIQITKDYQSIDRVISGEKI